MKSVLVAAALAVALVTPALAVDFSAPVTKEDGEPYMECLKPDPANANNCLAPTVPMTLGHMVANALNVPAPGLKNDVIVARGLLAMKIREARSVDLTAQERDLIKACLFESVERLSYRPVAVVQALRAIDPASLESAK